MNDVSVLMLLCLMRTEPYRGIQGSSDPTWHCDVAPLMDATRSESPTTSSRSTTVHPFPT